MSAINTGPGGSTGFWFHYQPDEIGMLVAPRQYQRVEVAYSDTGIADGVIAKVLEHDEGGWALNVVVGPERALEVADAVRNGGLAVRVLG